MGQEDSFSAGHMPPAICFYFLCPTLGIPSFLSASCFQFFILVYLLPSKLVCFWRTRLFDSNLWLLVFRPLEQYLAFAGPMWIVHNMWWSFSFNLTFLTVSIDASWWIQGLERSLKKKPCGFYPIYFATSLIPSSF